MKKTHQELQLHQGDEAIREMPHNEIGFDRYGNTKIVFSESRIHVRSWMSLAVMVLFVSLGNLKGKH